MRSSGAHCDPELAKRIGEKVGEADGRGGEGGRGGGGRAALIKSSNHHLAGGKNCINMLFMSAICYIKHS